MPVAMADKRDEAAGGGSRPSDGCGEQEPPTDVTYKLGSEVPRRGDKAAAASKGETGWEDAQGPGEGADGAVESSKDKGVDGAERRQLLSHTKPRREVSRAGGNPRSAGTGIKLSASPVQKISKLACRILPPIAAAKMPGRVQTAALGPPLEGGGVAGSVRSRMRVQMRCRGKWTKDRGQTQVRTLLNKGKMGPVAPRSRCGQVRRQQMRPN